MAGTWTGAGKQAIVYDLAQVTPRDWATINVGLGTVGGLSGEDVTIDDLGEVSGGSYAEQSLASQGWTNEATSDTVSVQAVTPPGFALDLMGAGVVVRNVFWVDTSDNTLLWYEIIDDRAVDPVADTVTINLFLGANTLPLP